jgi:membrane associated rhomboid family serine protease
MPSAAITVRTERGEERLDLEEFEARVARGEIAPQCPVLFPAVTGERWVPAGTLEIFRQRYSPRRLHFASAFRLSAFPRMTTAFILVNLAFYLLIELRPRADVEDTLLYYGAKAGPLLFDLGQYWRLLTANFVHKDPLHIAVNLFVLFNFAGALENAYRPLDMLLLFFNSALGTTLLSTAVVDPVSAGASGVAYGALGGAAVFGLKYRAILPERYRGVLGGAVVPTVLVFLFIGWTSSSVDNWGHLGGLCAGSLTVAALKPRLLSDPPSLIRSLLTRVLPVAAATALLFMVGPLTRGVLPRLTHELDDDLGLSLAFPSEWERGAPRFGGRTYFNGLSGYGHAHLSAAGSLLDTAPRLGDLLDDLVQKELLDPQKEDRLHVDRLDGPVASSFLGLPALTREARFSVAGDTLVFRAIAACRGRLCYVLEMAWDEDTPGYRGLFDRLMTEARLEEPAFLRQARARRLFAPDSPAAKEGLDDALAALRGAPDAAQ